MDIKDLNKVQLILLALLLSFITSIATGITTVTLMQQAPSSVTMPINRIVRQTVEKIVPVEGKTTIETVIIKEEDLVVEAIAANQSSVFVITKEIFDINGQKMEVSAGFGFVVSADGAVVSDSVFVPERGTYYVKNDSGKFKAEFLYADKDGFSFLRIGEPVDGKSKISFALPSPGEVSKMKRGQKIIVLGDTTASLIFEGSKDIKIVVTKSNAGGMVLNLAGEVLGVALLNDQKSFIAMETILASLKTIETPAN